MRVSKEGLVESVRRVYRSIKFEELMGLRKYAAHEVSLLVHVSLS
jgi:hypothetical protein